MFWGLQLDSISMVVRVPDDKLTEMYEVLLTFIKARKVTKREIQSLVGKLNWITQCVL